MMNTPATREQPNPLMGNADFASNACSRADSLSENSSNFLDKLQELSPLQRYPASVELYPQGSPPLDVYFIEQGLVKLIRTEEDGRTLIVNLRFPGNLLGDTSVISGRLNPFTAVTLIPSAIRRIPADAFCHLLLTDVRFSWYTHQIQSRVSFDDAARVVQLGCMTARQRLEQLLWQLISTQAQKLPQQQGVRLEMSLKHWEVAGLIAVAPAYLSRLLNQLEQDGTLRRRSGWLIIQDPQKLWHDSDS